MGEDERPTVSEALSMHLGSIVATPVVDIPYESESYLSILTPVYTGRYRGRQCRHRGEMDFTLVYVVRQVFHFGHCTFRQVWWITMIQLAETLIVLEEYSI